MQAEQIRIIDNRKAYRKRLNEAHIASPFNVDLLRRLMWSKLKNND